MRKKCFIVATAIVLSRCATTRILNPKTSAKLPGIELAESYKAEVTLADGRRFVVSQLQIKPDSTRWFDGIR